MKKEQLEGSEIDLSSEDDSDSSNEDNETTSVYKTSNILRLVKRYWWIIGVVLLVVIAGFIVYTKFSSTDEVQNTVDQAKYEDSGDWESVSLPALGLSLEKIKGWRGPRINDFGTITKLDGLKSKDGSEVFVDPIRITYPGGGVPVIYFYDTQVGDRLAFYSEEDGSQLKRLSSPPSLNQESDICDYVADIDRGYYFNPITKFYSSCEDNISVVLMEKKRKHQSGDPVPDELTESYVYDLYATYYKPTPGWIHQNMLVVNDIASLVFIEKPVASFDEFFTHPKSRLTKDEYREELKKFIRYAKSVAVSQPQTLENQLVIQDDIDIDLGIVQSFYQFIIDEDLDRAKLYYQTSPDDDIFSRQYGNMYKVILTDIQKLSVGTLQFIAETQKHNTSSHIPSTNLFRITLTTTDDKIVEEKIEEIVGSYISKDNLFISGLHTDGRNYFVLNEEGEERVLEETLYDTNDDFENIYSEEFSNPAILENEKYLKYHSSGYHYWADHYYDLENHEKLFTAEMPGTSGLSRNYNHFYNCKQDLWDKYTRTITIRSVPDFEILNQTDEDSVIRLYDNFDCTYDTDKDVLYVNLSSPKEGESNLETEQVLQYNFQTRESWFN